MNLSGALLKASSEACRPDTCPANFQPCKNITPRIPPLSYDHSLLLRRRDLSSFYHCYYYVFKGHFDPHQILTLSVSLFNQLKNMFIENSSSESWTTAMSNIVDKLDPLLPNDFVTSRKHQLHNIAHPEQLLPVDPALSEWERAHIHVG